MTDLRCPGGCVLAIVGSRLLQGNAEAERAIREVFEAHRPRHFVSGGAVGVDSMAEAEADRRGYPKTIHLPEQRNWNSYKKRDQLIANDAECLVRIYAAWATSYGSGWTADQAEKRGARVWRIRIGRGPQFVRRDDMSDKKTTGVPGPLVPDRTALPDPKDATTRGIPTGQPHDHPHTNTVEGLDSPEVEAHAPGRTTDGATNNP